MMALSRKLLDKNTLRWTQDADYVWHAINKLDVKGVALCNPTPEFARSGLFKYPRHMLSFGDVCKQCNDIATEVAKSE